MARGAAVLMVTHDREQAERLADRQFVMNRGRLAPADEAGAESEAKSGGTE